MWSMVNAGAGHPSYLLTRDGGGGQVVLGMCRKKTKKKPMTALDAFVRMAYGSPPPPKTARLDEAIRIAADQFLLGAVPRQDVADLAAKLDRSPIPYSTNDLAVSIALNFFRQPARIDQLRNAQLAARTKLLEWTLDRKVNPVLAKALEETLCELYKPAA
jgi:hypothetical protein